MINADSFELEKITADICIIGSGVAGITLANELKNSGKKVVILEAGNEEYSEESQSFYDSDFAPENFPNTKQSRLRMLGGSSNHWENSTERFDSIDFEKRSWVANSGWPITYESVARFYPEAEKYCGVKNGTYSFEYWENKLSLKDDFSDSDLFDLSMIKQAAPPTNFFLKYGKAFSNVSNIEIIYNATVTDIFFDQESEKVKSVTFLSRSGSKSHITSNIFVMCMGGVENARLLLIFNEKYENNLGNKFENVGKYFMEHPVLRGLHLYPTVDGLADIYNGIFKEGMLLKSRLKIKKKLLYKNKINNLRYMFLKQSNRLLSHGISSTHIIGNSLKNGDFPDEFGTHLINIIKDIDLISDTLLSQKFNISLSDDADKFVNYQILTMLEQSPERDNEIRLSKEKDALGMKKIQINWKVSEADKQLAWRSINLLSTDNTIVKLGRIRVLDERLDRLWGDQLGYSQHHMGTTRMSATEKNGVVDKHCKVFGCKNLFIAGSSVFPTGGHVPPTLTIVALTIKLAKELKANYLS